MKTCLIVDDSITVRAAIRAMAQSMGLSVKEAADGSQALARVADHLPDVIILDWNMPVMDGLTCLREFRRLYPAARTRVVMCTTENELDRIQTALDCGVDEYLIKPFDAEIFASKLQLAGMT